MEQVIEGDNYYMCMSTIGEHFIINLDDDDDIDSSHSDTELNLE